MKIIKNGWQTEMKAFYNTESYTVEKKRIIRLTETGKQRILGMLLIIIGIIMSIAFPEDATGGDLLILLGLARALTD